MPSHECIPLESSAAWAQALSGIPHGFAHTRENCYAMFLTTHFPTYLYTFRSERARIVCPIAERAFKGYTDAVTPFGFSGFIGVGDCTAFHEHWESFALRRGYVCSYATLNPLFSNPAYVDATCLHCHNTIFCIDLTLPFDCLVSNLSRNRKRQLQDSNQQRGRLVHDRALLKTFFLDNYAECFTRKGASMTYQFSQHTVEHLLSQPNVVLVGFADDNRIQAVLLFAYTQYVVDLMFEVSLPGRHHASAHLLWWAVNYFKSLNMPTLNLGGGVRPNDGIAEFKRRFGAKELDLLSVRQVHQPEIYRNLCSQVGSDPDERSGYFPSYQDFHLCPRL
jgi:hypothetical protein